MSIHDSSGKVAKKFTAGDTMLVKMSWTKPGVKYAGVAILRQSGEYIFGPNTYQDKYEIKGESKELTYKVVVNLGEGTYFLKAGIFGNNDSRQIDFEENGPTFVINRNKDDTRWGGVTKLDYEWK
jgi:hypothetical protein